MKRTAGKPETIKRNNQYLIIETVKKYNSISRADLAKLLKLSATSISNNIDQLLKKRILLEIGEGESIGGRKPILLEFNYNYGYVIGIDLSSEVIRVALGDLGGNIIDTHYVPLPQSKLGIEILKTIIDTIKNITKANHIQQNQLMVIVIGSPGIINENTGYIEMAPQFEGWDKINVLKEVENEFNVKVIIKNDINLSAIGECYYGIGKEFNNLIYISVDLGVGAGIIIDRHLYEGARYAAGEIGYIAPSLNVINYKKEEFGPLEREISIPSVIQKIKQEIEKGQDTLMLQLVNNNINNITTETLEKALTMGDSYAINAIEQMAKILGWVIANISILLDMELVIIGGEVVKFGYSFIQPLRETVNRICPLSTTVMYSSLNENSGIYGAFAMALEYVFNTILD